MLYNYRVDVQSQDAQSQSWFDNSSSTEQTPMTSSLDIEPYNQTHRFDDLPNLPLDAGNAFSFILYSYIHMI